MSNISIGELTVIADTGHTRCGDASAMARELLEYRKASNEPVGVTDRSEIACLMRGEMANVMPPDYKGVDKGDEVFLYAAPQFQPVSNPYTLPDGWVMMPSELTSGMQGAWDSAPNGNEDDDVNMRNAYRAMLAAAPQPEKCHK